MRNLSGQSHRSLTRPTSNGAELDVIFEPHRSAVRAFQWMTQRYAAEVIRDAERQQLEWMRRDERGWER